MVWSENPEASQRLSLTVYAIGAALLLGSWPAVVRALMLNGVVAYRAVLEERVLHAELDGYDAYAARVRWRFLPRI
jgi:protein-S-isoprenylcysteine O-methyltransferase Ste14